MQFQGIILFGFGVLIVFRGFYVLIESLIRDSNKLWIRGSIELVVGTVLLVVGHFMMMWH